MNTLQIMEEITKAGCEIEVYNLLGSYLMDSLKNEKIMNDENIATIHEIGRLNDGKDEGIASLCAAFEK